MEARSDTVEILREAYRLWHNTRGGSVAHWLSLMAEDTTMQSVGDGAAGIEFAKPRHGKAEAAMYFAALVADWELLHFTPQEFIAQGNRVVVLSQCAFRNRRTGKTAESMKADIFRFRDGLIVEFQEFFDTAQALATSRAD